MEKGVFKLSTATAEDLSELLLTEVAEDGPIGKALSNDAVVPDIDMDAISAAIESALGGAVESAIAGALEATPPEIVMAKSEEDEFIEKVAAGAVKRAKAKDMKLRDVTKKDSPSSSTASSEPKEKKPRAPRSASTPLPKESLYGTPVIRAAKDKCSTCEAVVTWYSTTDNTGAPIWECSVCKRVVPRKAKKAV